MIFKTAQAFPSAHASALDITCSLFSWAARIPLAITGATNCLVLMFAQAARAIGTRARALAAAAGP